MAWKRWMAGFDIHGDDQDKATNKAFFAFADDWQPHIRICGGDLFNFNALRRNANEEERRQSLRTDFEAGERWIERFRATQFLRGNHDERLWDLAQSDNGILAEYAQSGISRISENLRKLGTRVFPYCPWDGVYRVGKLAFVHGFCSGVNAARRTAIAYGVPGGITIMGHGHGKQYLLVEGPDNRIGIMAGCLCGLRMKYARGALASTLWRNCWVYGIVSTTSGNCHAWLAEKIDGKWRLPTELREF